MSISRLAEALAVRGFIGCKKNNSITYCNENGDKISLYCTKNKETGADGKKHKLIVIPSRD